jgi:hypothetical protein
VQIGDAVGECVEQLGDDHAIIVAPRFGPQWVRSSFCGNFH